MSNNACPENQCTCSNGVGATDTTCPTHGTEFCISCNSGYTLTGNQCIADNQPTQEEVNEVNNFLNSVGVDNSDKEVAITIYWQQNCDMDLHVVQPDGEEIFYGNLCNNQNTACLDIDMTRCPTGSCAENIGWTTGIHGEYRAYSGV